ncbi:hypothetical protein [Fontivita pretiosa]|uniref:hypothetical protein n=1 Tax=Fontivita pretiosa TaxID=2989684 RepID=UPI003D16292B
MLRFFWGLFFAVGLLLVVLSFRADVFVGAHWTMIQSSCLAWVWAVTLQVVGHRWAYAAASVAIAIFWVQLCFQVALWIGQFVPAGDFRVAYVRGHAAIVFVPLTCLRGIVLRYRLWRGVPPVLYNESLERATVAVHLPGGRASAWRRERTTSLR